MKAALTWGELRTTMEALGVPDLAIIVLEVEVPSMHVGGKPVVVSRPLTGYSNESTHRFKLRAT